MTQESIDYYGNTDFSKEDLFPKDPEDSREQEDRRFGVALSAQYYQKQVSRLDVLPQAETAILAQKVHQGQRASVDVDILRWEEGREAEVIDLERKVKEGEAAQWRIVTGNLRLAAHVARLTMGWVPFGSERVNGRGESVFRGAIIKDLSVFAGVPLPLEDRIQAATEGLIQAAKKYKPGKATFTTYAMYWIEQAIVRAIAVDRNIKIPIDVVDMLRIRGDQELAFTQEMGRTSSENEIRELTTGRIGLDNYYRMEDARKTDKTTPIHELDKRIYDRTEDMGHDELIHQIFIEDVVDRGLTQLPEIERDILAMRFGMVTGQPMTLEEIGAQIGGTRERVRQLEGQALARLAGLHSTQF